MTTRVQYKAAYADPAVPTFDSAPTEGNLLVAVGSERSGTGHASFTINGTGWTKRGSVDHNLNDNLERFSFAVWTKIAGASEPSAISIDNGTSNNKLGFIQEFALGGGEDSFDFLEFQGNAVGSQTGISSPLSTGNTASVSGTSFFVLPIGALKEGSTLFTGALFANGGSDIWADLGGTNSINYCSAFSNDSTTGVRSDSMSWTGGSNSKAAIATIMVFSLAATGTSITYGHDTAVAEDNIENFTGLWSGTGSIVGSGDNESIELDNSEYMELTDPYEIGVGLCRWTDGKYQSTTGTLIKKYKTGSTSIACEADTWHTYTIPFVCSEFVKLRVEAPA